MRDEELAALERYSSKLIISKLINRTVMESNAPTLGFLLHDVARLLKRRFEQNARGSGLTRSQWQVLAYLANNEGINQSSLIDLLEIEPITLCRIVDKLQTLGLIERRSHPSDRRVWLLHLKPAARPKLSLLRALGEVTRGEALAEVPEADIARLLRTLQTLKANLMDACGSPVAGQKRANHG
jgi:MarR family transcriptional regulator, transcriptional regulator for hemolysin